MVPGRVRWHFLSSSLMLPFNPMPTRLQVPVMSSGRRLEMSISLHLSCKKVISWHPYFGLLLLLCCTHYLVCIFGNAKGVWLCLFSSLLQVIVSPELSDPHHRFRGGNLQTIKAENDPRRLTFHIKAITCSHNLAATWDDIWIFRLNPSVVW